MAIDCNILNAIGGTPKIDDPCFVPRYPGHLPGGVGSLIVGLAPFQNKSSGTPSWRLKSRRIHFTFLCSP